MKIYVPSTPLTTICKKKHILDKYLKEKTNKMIAYSVDGIFIVNDNSIKKLVILTDHTYKCILNGIDFIVDDSKIEHKTENYMPFNHEITKIIEYKYLLHPKSNLTVIVECEHDELFPDSFKPINFYFETKIEEKINNSIIRNDLFEFLSLLN